MLLYLQCRGICHSRLAMCQCFPCLERSRIKTASICISVAPLVEAKQNSLALFPRMSSSSGTGEAPLSQLQPRGDTGDEQEANNCPQPPRGQRKRVQSPLGTMRVCVTQAGIRKIWVHLRVTSGVSCTATQVLSYTHLVHDESKVEKLISTIWMPYFYITVLFRCQKIYFPFSVNM